MEHPKRMVGVPAALLLMAAILVPAPTIAERLAPPAEPDVPVDARPAGSVITIGDGLQSEGDFTGSDEMPFVAALAALPEGGEIVVRKGTYAFRTPVVVRADDITVRGEGATLLSSAQVSVGLFDVTGDDVRLDSLEMVDHLPITGHSLVRVHARRFRIQGCTFRGRDARRALPSFLELSSHSLGPRTSAWVTGNEFHPHRGWTIVRASHLSELHVTDNAVMGNAVGERRGRGFLAYGVQVEDVGLARIHGNVFFELGDARTPVHAAIVARGEEVGHLLSVENNVFHTLAAERALLLEGTRHQTVSRNAFGALAGSHVVATVDVDAPAGADAGGLHSTFEGNTFESHGGAPAVRINGGSGHVVVDNSFESELVSVLAGDRTPADAVSVLSNAFQAVGEDRLAYPAVLLLGGSQHVVHGNELTGHPTPGIVLSGSATTDAHVSDNEEK